MKDTSIKIGTCYDLKVAKHTTPVRITKTIPGGWEAVGLSTGKTMVIKSAKRLVGVHRPKSPTTPQGAAKETRPNQDITDQPSTNTAKPVQNTLRTRRMSILDAAAKVLAEVGTPLNCKQMIEAMTAKGYWKPVQSGKTPANTLHAAISKEIKTKGTDSRFEKVGRGQFALSTTK